MFKRVLMFVLVSLVVVGVAGAVVPLQMNIQGRLADDKGPIVNATLTFKVLTTNKLIPTDPAKVITDSQGIFNAALDFGKLYPNLHNFPTDGLDIQVFQGNTVLTTQTIRSVPYAFLAENLTPGNKTITGNLTVTGDLLVKGNANLKGTTTIESLVVNGSAILPADTTVGGVTVTPGGVAGDFVKKSGDEMTGGLKVEFDAASAEKALYGKAKGSGVLLHYGGYFVAQGKQGRAVYGNATSTDPSAENYAGYFEADGGKGVGVYARGLLGKGVHGVNKTFNVNAPLDSVGVKGEGKSAGVQGISTGLSNTGIGVLGLLGESGLNTIFTQGEKKLKYNAGVFGGSEVAAPGVYGIGNPGLKGESGFQDGAAGISGNATIKVTKKEATNRGVTGSVRKEIGTVGEVYAYGDLGVYGTDKNAYPHLYGVFGYVDKFKAKEISVVDYYGGYFSGGDRIGAYCVGGVYGLQAKAQSSDPAIQANGIGISAMGDNRAIEGISEKGDGVVGVASAQGKIGVIGNSNKGTGVHGFSADGVGIRGATQYGFAGKFIGSVEVQGNLNIKAAYNLYVEGGSIYLKLGNNYIKVTDVLQNLQAENKLLKEKLASLDSKLNDFIAKYGRDREVASR